MNIDRVFTETENTAGRDRALDVLRAIAALTVAAGHANFIPKYYANAGVWLFFTLSGYLLTGPMLRPGALRPAWIAAYLFRRFARLYPAWLFLIAVLAAEMSTVAVPSILTPDTDELSFFWSHATLHDAESYFWTVKMELLLYAFLPLVMLFVVPLYRRPHLCALGLVLLAIAADFFLTQKVFSVRLSAEWHQPLRLSPFLCGMAAKIFTTKKAIENFIGPLTQRLLLCALVATVVILPMFVTFLTFDYPVVYGLIFAPVILIVHFIKGGIWELTLRQRHLARLGLWGYGFYLWHFPMLAFATVAALQYGSKNTALIFVLDILFTIPCAALSFTLIEHPAIRGSRWLTQKLLSRKNV